MLVTILFAQISAVGAGIGSPTGLSVMFSGDIRTLAGWNFDRGTFYISIDKDFYARSAAFEPLDFYLGFGGYLFGLDVSNVGNPPDNEIYFGMRVPIGIEYMFQDVPVSLGLEVSPSLNVIPKTEIFFFADIYAMFHFE